MIPIKKILESLKKFFSFKNEDYAIHFQYLHPYLFYILGHLIVWAWRRNLPVTFTDIIRDRLPSSISDTHAEGRAIDMSVKGWNQKDIDDCVLHFNMEFSHLGTGPYQNIHPKVMVYEVRTMEIDGKQIEIKHIHIQVKRGEK